MNEDMLVFIFLVIFLILILIIIVLGVLILIKWLRRKKPVKIENREEQIEKELKPESPFVEKKPKGKGWINDLLVCLIVISIGYFIMGKINEVYYRNFISLLFYFFIFPVVIALVAFVFLGIFKVFRNFENLKNILLASYVALIIPFIYELTKGFFYDYQKIWQNFTLIGTTIFVFIVLYLILGKYIFKKLK